MASFTYDALTVIQTEAERALGDTAGYRGVAFEDPRARGSIWVAYCRQPTIWIGQEQRHPAHLWADMCLAMRLMGRLLHQRGLTKVINLHESFFSATWVLDPTALSTEQTLQTLELFLTRADEAMQLLDQPLALDRTVAASLGSREVVH